MNAQLHTVIRNGRDPVEHALTQEVHADDFALETQRRTEERITKARSLRVHAVTVQLRESREVVTQAMRDLWGAYRVHVNEFETLRWTFSSGFRVWSRALDAQHERSLSTMDTGAPT